MPRFLSSVTVVRRWGSDRPSRSNFQTTETVTGLYESKRLGQAGAITATAAGSILKQVTLVYTGGEERVTLQVQHLTVALGGDAHVADQHVRKTPSGRFPHCAPFRQGLSYSFLAINHRPRAPLAVLTGIM